MALFWIRDSHKEWKQFVQNRMNEICELVPGSHWNHCRSQENPADIPSRGVVPKELISNNLWWSNTTEELIMPAECAVEMKAVTHSLLMPDPLPGTNLGQLILCTCFADC